MANPVLRTASDGCFQLRDSHWGSYLAEIPDPLADFEPDKKILSSFELREGLPKIPYPLFSRWLSLCIHLANKRSTLEVSARLLVSETDDSLWRIIIPRQSVCAASVEVDSFDDSIDIETGEVITSYPPDGWIPAGSTHSHNTMALDRFSTTDDKSELGDPGLHILISHCRPNGACRVTASVTASHRRFYIDTTKVVELDGTPQGYHPSVLEVIEIYKPALMRQPAVASLATAQGKRFAGSWGDQGAYFSDDEGLELYSNDVPFDDSEEFDELTQRITDTADDLFVYGTSDDLACLRASIQKALDHIDSAISDSAIPPQITAEELCHAS